MEDVLVCHLCAEIACAHECAQVPLSVVLRRRIAADLEQLARVEGVELTDAERFARLPEESQQRIAFPLRQSTKSVNGVPSSAMERRDAISEEERLVAFKERKAHEAIARHREAQRDLP